MLNVKALTWAFGLTAIVAFCVYVAYGLMVPPEYGVLGFHGITLTSFLIGLIQMVVAAVIAALLVGTLNNYFHRRWEMTHEH